MAKSPRPDASRTSVAANDWRPHAPMSRRSLLRGFARGAAVSVALPPLEAMFNATGTAYACDGILRACQTVRAAAADRLQERAPDTVRALVSLNFGDGMVQQKLKLSTKGLYLLRDDVESICRHHFGASPWIRVEVN